MYDPGEPAAPTVRPRTSADLDVLAPIARAVHALDGYPPVLPDGDLHGFLASDDALGAWVAESQGDVVGHVALHTRSSPAVMDLACGALGLGPGQLVVVARLLVAPAVRRRGVGRALLDTAVDEAARRHLRAILDVGTGLPNAVALYDSAGWRRLGQVQVRFRNGTVFGEFVYTDPSPLAQADRSRD